MGVSREKPGEPKPRWRRRADERPDEILDAALEEFTDRGFDATRVEDIAARAKISKAGVYLYFDRKEDILRALIEREVKTPEPDETSCRRFFRANHQRFRTGDLFEVSHILCAAPPDDAMARAEARARAESALGQLADDGGNFAELATTLSDCPSKQNGGSLGQIGSGQTVPEFEQALLDMREGEISSQPLESRFGFHLIRLHRKTEGQTLAYEKARDQIAGYLRESAQRQGISRYLSLLIGRADIAGIDLLGTDSPLAR